jgi:hypothetical protein
MKGFVSFHPIDLALFDDLIGPLVAGRKVNPEAYLAAAPRIRTSGWVARRYAVALQGLVIQAEAPKADPSSNLWQRLRTNLERMDYKPEEAARRAAQAFDPDLHLDGRPFFIAENSAERVAATVDAYVDAGTEAGADLVARDQLARLDPELAKTVEPEDIADISSDLLYRDELLSALKSLHDLGRLARDGKLWGIDGQPPRPAVAALPEELPWRAMSIHARVRPFWLGRDVDGLETICKAAGVAPPACLSPAWRPFAESCEAFPSLREMLGLELRQARAVGAFVAPSEIGQLLEFLAGHGARIIGAATRAGEGPMATALLRKIKECAVYAQKHGYGYVEAAGVLPPERDGET